MHVFNFQVIIDPKHEYFSNWINTFEQEDTNLDRVQIELPK